MSNPSPFLHASSVNPMEFHSVLNILIIYARLPPPYTRATFATELEVTESWQQNLSTFEKISDILIINSKPPVRNEKMIGERHHRSGELFTRHKKLNLAKIWRK